MPMTDEDKELLAGLTEQERAELAEGDDDGATNDEAGDAAGDDPGADGDGADAADDTAGAEAADADGEAEAGAGQPPEPAKSAPLLVAEAPVDAKERLDKIAEDKGKVMAQFEDGDITSKEYAEQLDALGKQEREVERALDRAEIATSMETQRQKNQWDADCASFLETNPEYKDPEHFAKINEAVIALANMPSNRDLSGPQILAKAHRFVKADAPEPAPKLDDPKTTKLIIPKPSLPPNLAKVPSSTAIDTGEGRFAALDRLAEHGGMAFEEALAKLSESEREAYLTA